MSISCSTLMPSPHEIQMVPFFPPSGAVARASGASHFASSVPSVTARKTSSGEASSSTVSSMSRVAWLMGYLGGWFVSGFRVGERHDAMDASARRGRVVVLGGEPRDLARELLGERGTVGGAGEADLGLERERREPLAGLVGGAAHVRELADRARRDRDDVGGGEPIGGFERALRERGERLGGDEVRTAGG